MSGSIDGILSAYLKSNNWTLSEGDLQYWASVMHPGEIKKGGFLLRQGEMTDQTWFVTQGCLRMYSIDAKGKEHILQFAPENWWLSDLTSSGSHLPSQLNVDALEDTRYLSIGQQQFDSLLIKIPSLGLFFRGLLTKRQAAMQQRMIGNLSATAEERYEAFQKTYPSLSRRLPLHQIASWLGITPESLSRIRKKH